MAGALEMWHFKVTHFLALFDFLINAAAAKWNLTKVFIMEHRYSENERIHAAADYTVVSQAIRCAKGSPGSTRPII